MTQKKIAILIAIAMTVVATSLSGCGSTDSGTALSGQSQAAKANVTLAAKFPSSGDAVKSLIPAGTQVIEVYANQQGSSNQPELLATLTVAAPSKTVKMVPGLYYISASAYDSSDTTTRKWLGQASTGGEIQLGVTNNVNLTFLNGQWTLVDSVDNPTPLVLSNGTQLVDFIIANEGEPGQYKAGKSSIDYTKPVGGGGGMVRLRFDNNTSARTFGHMVSQFVGTGNSTLVSSDSYNLTKKCGFDSYYGIPCDETAGDQIVMISSKDGGSSQSSGSNMGTMLYGSAESLLPGGGRTTFTQNGVAIDLTAAMPDTTVTGGTLIAGGIVEWKPATNKITTLGTPAAVAKMVKSATAVKAQSSNTAYTNLTVKDFETIVCSGANPLNRGSWAFANNTSAGKVVLGSRVCYTNNPYLNPYNYTTMQPGADAGDYSYGLVPLDINNLGDYCHQWDYSMYLPYDPFLNPTGTTLNPGYNTCKQQLPGSGDIYRLYNFQAVKSASKTTINYGSFKLNFWKESTQTGSAYIYPFRAKGSTTVKAVPAAPVITGLRVPASVATGTTTATLTAAAFDVNGDNIIWNWSVVSGGGSLGAGCSGSGPGPVTSSCAYTPPTTAATVVLRFSASDGVKTSTLSGTLSVSDGTSVVIQ